jgi:predicted aldo/keto reductase-like oxidoreductase
MQTRLFGRTGHHSTLAIFGAAAFWEIDQARADQVLDLLLAHGINHIDVAPSYGQAELRVGLWMDAHRARFFLGCKTTERTREGAAAEFNRSLERLHTERFDLYQLHAVTSFAELDQVTAKGGALEAVRDMQQQGLTRFIGITGHGVDSPAIFIEALRRFDFDTILFPLNYIQYANPVYQQNSEELLRLCQEKQVGVMVIKSITRGPWADGQPHTHTTWYEPFSDHEHIQPAVDFALSQPVTGLCTAGDVTVLPLMLQACENFQPMDQAAQETLVASAGEYTPLFS